MNFLTSIKNLENVKTKQVDDRRYVSVKRVLSSFWTMIIFNQSKYKMYMKEAWENYSKPDIIFIVMSCICIIFYTTWKYFHILSDPLYSYIKLESDSYPSISQFLSERSVASWVLMV